MEDKTIQISATMADLVCAAHEASDPVIVFDGEDECLVAMRPSVFERILFDGDRLAGESGVCAHF